MDRFQREDYKNGRSKERTKTKNRKTRTNFILIGFKKKVSSFLRALSFFFIPAQNSVKADLAEEKRVKSRVLMDKKSLKTYG